METALEHWTQKWTPLLGSVAATPGVATATTHIVLGTPLARD